MRVVEVERRPPGVQRRTPVGEPTGDVLDGDVLLLDVGARRVVGFQMRLPASAAPWDAVRDRLDHLAWYGARPAGSRGGPRVAGFSSPHRTFGWAPAQVIHRRYLAQRADLNVTESGLVAALRQLGDRAWAESQERLPKLSEAHRAGVATIPPCWRFGEAWTSGIINRTTTLPYHTDAANVPGCLSAMVALRDRVDGGALHLAPYGVWLAVPDRSLTVFSGATVMHGVSPLVVRPGGHRYTAVLYVRAGLARAAPTYEDEVRRAQLLATSHDHLPDR